MLKKVFALFTILCIVLAQVEISSNIEKQTSSFSKKYLNKVLLSSIAEDAIQELCPFPGYHGTYCPQQNPSFLSYKRQLQQGVSRMPSGIGASFDISTGELKLPAVQLTYSNEGNVYTDPYSGRQFVLADETQVEQVNLDADIKIFKNEFELTNIWLDATQRGQWLGGEYSQSKDLNDVFQRFFKGNQETSISQLLKNVVRLTFKSDYLKLNRFAQRAIDALPEDFQPDIYNEFLNAWGTHVAVDTYIGGMIEKQTVFKDCVYYTPSFTGGLSTDQLIQALHNELNGNPADGYFVARRIVSIDHKFGGNPEDVANWESTISSNPALLKINRFISWDNFSANPSVRANLLQAINNRVEAMRQRQQSYQAQIREERRIQNNAPRQAFAITGAGLVPGGTTTQFFNIRNQFTMLEASQCPPGLPFEVSYQRCSSGDMTTPEGYVYDVRYERDDQGKFRCILHNIFNPIDHEGDDFYGPWVDRGCSIAQRGSLPQYTDLNTIPPDLSRFKMICTDCIPSTYNALNGQTLLNCNCPGF